MSKDISCVNPYAISIFKLFYDKKDMLLGQFGNQDKMTADNRPQTEHGISLLNIKEIKIGNLTSDLI